MASVQEAEKWVRDLLANDASLEQFEDWSASFSLDIHNSGDPEAQAIAYQIRSILNQHSDDLTEEALRLELASAIHPSAENRFGGPSPIPIPESNAEVAVNIAIAA